MPYKTSHQTEATLKPHNSISEELIINRKINDLFDFTQNFSERKKWDKQTKEIKFMDGYSKLRKGAKVYTESSEGIKMETEYLTFNPSSEISIKMLNHSRVFKSFIGTWNYVELKKKKTLLKITYEFNLRFPYSIIPMRISKRIKNNMVNKLRFLEAYLEKKEDEETRNS